MAAISSKKYYADIMKTRDALMIISAGIAVIVAVAIVVAIILAPAGASVLAPALVGIVSFVMAVIGHIPSTKTIATNKECSNL